MEIRMRDHQRKQSMMKKIFAENGTVLSPDEYSDAIFQAELIDKREQWSMGRIPGDFEFVHPFIYAKSFLFALDYFQKYFQLLINEDDAPKKLKEIYANFNEKFPDIREMRNTTQHMDERNRGIGSRGRPLPQGNWMFNVLNDTAYGTTMGDGVYGSVDVSEKCLSQLHEILIGIVGCFEWNGPRQHFPSL